jgi:hypothetical protein
MLRPQLILTDFNRKYPKCWQQIDIFIADKGKDLPDWPDWCLVPIAATYAIVTAKTTNYHEMGPDMATMQALAGWRLTQGVYRFSPELYRSLCATALDEKLPIDLLYHMPEYCVYIELQEDEGPAGVFVTMEYDVNTGGHELRLLFDFDQGLVPTPIHLIPGKGVKAGLDKAREIVRNNVDQGLLPNDHQVKNLLTGANDLFVSSRLIQDAVNLTLYLCSEAPDISGQVPPAPTPKKTKKGLRHFPAKAPALLDVGYRVSKYLHQVREAGEGRGSQGDRSAPAPHIRRAHWHTFWTGPRKDPGRRVPVLRWIPPTPVGFRWDEVEGQLVPTVREVQGQ